MGYRVSANGALTARLLNAWKHYSALRHAAPGTSPQHAERVHHAVTAWNQEHPLDVSARKTQAYADHLKNQRGKDKKGLTNAVARAGKHTVAKSRAAAHAQHLGAGGGHKVGGGGIPGVAEGGPAIGEADQLAGLQFDPQIREATLEQLRQRRDQSQAERDIGSWSDQVSASQGTARTRDQAAGASASSDVRNVIQGLMDSLGSSRGAGVIGAAGVNDLTSLDAQGAAQNTYNNDLAPILAGERATNLSRQRALGSQQQEKLSAALIDLQGQRGQAKAKNLMDIKQQRFQNKLALQNAALAAESMGMKESEFQAQLQQMGLSNKMNRAKLRAEQQANKAASGHANWATMNDTDRQVMIDRALKTGMAAIPQGAPWDPGHVMNVALGYLRQAGFGSARKNSFTRRGGKVPNRRNQAAILGRLHQAILTAGQNYGQSAA
jgi:hypothetical protein